MNFTFRNNDTDYTSGLYFSFLLHVRNFRIYNDNLLSFEIWNLFVTILKNVFFLDVIQY